MNRSTFWMIKYMNGSVFSKARYMNEVGFEILARTPVPKLPLSYPTSSTDLFETLQVFLSWSEDVHLVFGLSSHYFFIYCFHFFDLVFFQVRLLLEYLVGAIPPRVSTDPFETMHTC